MPVRWSTLITEVDDKGVERVSLHRLRKFLVLAWFCVGMAAIIIATMVEVMTRIEVPTDMIMILAGSAVLPVTGGQISDAYFQTRLSTKIQAGEARGRRSADTLVPPSAG